MLRAQKLTKRYATKIAVDGLSFDVNRGEILGFVGPNGAGKSTTAKMVVGLVRPDSGTVQIDGFDVGTDPINAKRCLGYVPEVPALYESLTALEFIHLVGSLHHLSPNEAEKRATGLIEALDLFDARFDRLASFSKGMKQKVVLVASLLHRPSVLVLDEPLDGLDPSSTRIVKDLLRALSKAGTSILFSSHTLEVVEQLCDRLLVVQAGAKLTEGTSLEICAATTSKSLSEAFGKLLRLPDPSTISSSVLAQLKY